MTRGGDAWEWDWDDANYYSTRFSPRAARRRVTWQERAIAWWRRCQQGPLAHRRHGMPRGQPHAQAAVVVQFESA